MRHRFIMPAVALAIAVWLAAAVVATAADPKSSAKPYSPRRMSDGHPDLQGMYDLATLTPLERQPGLNAVLTKEEAHRIEAAAAKLKEQGDKPLQADRTAPPKGGDGSVGAAGNVGGYNYGWLDPGSAYTIVDGQIRSSLIIDPPNGRVPQLAPEAAQRMAAARARPTSDATESNDPGLDKTPGEIGR